MDKIVYQLKITLKDTKPPIWRRFLVDPSTKLSDLHKIIQTVMGWMNGHLHHFIKDGMFYSNPEDNEFGMDIIDHSKVRIKDILTEEGEKCIYEYDFGDSWEHEVKLEKLLPHDIKQFIPVCITGKRSCPPEDCGGTPGYENLLEIIADKTHPEYEEMMEWIGGEFDPEYFDLEDINEALKDEDYGCIDIF